MLGSPSRQSSLASRSRSSAGGQSAAGLGRASLSMQAPMMQQQQQKQQMKSASRSLPSHAEDDATAVRRSVLGAGDGTGVDVDASLAKSLWGTSADQQATPVSASNARAPGIADFMAGAVGASVGRIFRRSSAAASVAPESVHSELDEGDELAEDTSHGFPEPQVLFKKQVYKIYVSLFYGLLLLALALFDIQAVYREWEHEGLPAKWHTAVLYVQIVSFYMLVTGFIVANETGQSDCHKYGIASLAVNLLSFALRLFYELTFSDFVPVQYYPPEP